MILMYLILYIVIGFVFCTLIARYDDSFDAGGFYLTLFFWPIIIPVVVLYVVSYVLSNNNFVEKYIEFVRKKK